MKTDIAVEAVLPQNPRTYSSVELDEAHSPLKVLAQPELLKSFVTGTQIRPIHMRIGLIGACNMRCNFCNFHSHYETNFYDRFSYKDMIPTDKCVALFREFASEGGRAVTFCGSGECTIHPGYDSITRACFASGLRVGLITNGSMLHRSVIAECVHDTHTWVRIGLNAGSPSTFARITHSSPDTFERLLKSVSDLRERATVQDFRVGFNFVITDENRSEIEQAAELARGARAHYIRFEPEFYTAKGHATILKHLPQITSSLESARRFASHEFEVSVPKLDRGAMDQTEAVEGDFLHCHYSRFVTAVGADGNLYPCPQVHLNERYRIGNVIDEGYASVLNGGPRDRWEKSNPLRTDLCKTCFYRPQNELLEWLHDGRILLDQALTRYELEYPSTLHSDFI